MDPGLAILGDLLLLLSLSVGIVIGFHRLNLPPIVGFLTAGVMCGPHGFGLVADTREVEVLAELGVILLLFTVGIEFSLEKMIRLRLVLLLGGGLQVGLTVAVGSALAHAAGVDWPSAVFLGMLVSLSSTAIVIRLLAERGELDTPVGRAGVAVLIFQDICVVPMVLVVPLLAGGPVQAGPLLATAARALLFVTGGVLASKFVVPRLFRLAVATRRREVFVLSVALLCLGAAWISSKAGLSLALGAFMAGLVVSQSEYGIQALGEALPFREVFNSIFFVSIGLLLDFRIVLSSPLWVLGSVAAIILLKGAITGTSALLLGSPLAAAAATGLALAQIGEFSFVLSREGIDQGLLSPRLDQVFLAAAVTTMALTPLLHRLGRKVQELEGRAARWRIPFAGRELSPAPGAEAGEDHVIIVGYGVNGRNLARVLSSVEIPFVVIETNPFTVEEERRAGVPIIFGDATTPETLIRSGVERARVIVVAISDAAATRRVVATVRRLNARIHLIARTRYVQEVRPILGLGAQEVIPEEFETSVEIFARVLAKYMVPRDRIARCVRDVRQGAYEMLRSDETSQAPGGLQDYLGGLSFEVLPVEEGSPASHRSIMDLGLRRATGATVVARRLHSGAITPNPDPAESLEPGQAVIAVGTPEQLEAASRFFRGGSGRESADPPPLI